MYFGVNSKTATRIRTTGFRLRGMMISLRYLPGDSFLYSPVVSKKQGNAVRRNRIKRIIREIMRAGAGIYPPGSYLVFYNGTYEQLNRDEIISNIHTHMDSIQLKNAR